MPLIWPLCKMWASVSGLGSGQLTAAKVHGGDELAAESLHGRVSARILTLLRPLIALQQWWQLRVRLQKESSSNPQTGRLLLPQGTSVLPTSQLIKDMGIACPPASLIALYHGRQLCACLSYQYYTFSVQGRQVSP